MSETKKHKLHSSSATRWINCPASHKRCLGLPEETSEAAEEGTNLHKWCELARTQGIDEASLQVQLDSEQMQACLYAITRVNRILNDLESAEENNESYLVANSQLFSGIIDVLLISGNRAAVIDYKFGRGDVESAERNYQLAAYAVLVADNYPEIEEVDAYIIQPRSIEYDKRITSVHYTRADIDVARKELEAKANIALNSEQPPAKCGSWCKWCRFASQCPEARAEIESIKDYEITPENALKTFRKIKQVRMILDAMERKVKEIAQAQEIDGLEWVEGAKRAKFKDTQKTFEYFSQIIGAEKFVRITDISKSGLQKLYVETIQAMNPERKKAEIEREFNQIIKDAELIEYRQNAPTLKIKEDA